LKAFILPKTHESTRRDGDRFHSSYNLQDSLSRRIDVLTRSAIICVILFIRRVAFSEEIWSRIFFSISRFVLYPPTSRITRGYYQDLYWRVSELYSAESLREFSTFRSVRWCKTRTRKEIIIRFGRQFFVE